MRNSFTNTNKRKREKGQIQYRIIKGAEIDRFESLKRKEGIEDRRYIGYMQIHERFNFENLGNGIGLGYIIKSLRSENAIFPRQYDQSSRLSRNTILFAASNV